MELAAGCVHRSLLFVRCVVDCWTSVSVDGVTEQLVRTLLPQRGIVMQVADDLSAHCPEVVPVLANCLWGKPFGGQMFDEGPKANDQGFARWQVYL